MVYRVTDRRGREWFIPENSERFARWAFIFMEKHQRYLEALRENDVVVEVGACTGEYTIHAAQRVGEAGKVIAFEADPVGCECVKRNARINNLSNVEVVNEAVSDSSGKRVSLDIRVNITGGVIALDNEGTMLTTTLDKYLKGTKVDVIKLTVNGHESEVLIGAQELLKNVRCVIFQSSKYEDLINFLGERGFKVKKLENAYRGSGDVKTAMLERV